MLRLQQVRDGGVLDVVHRDVVQARGGDRRVVGELAVPELRCVSGPPEVVAGVDEIHRGHVEEEAEAARDVRQRPVDGQVDVGERLRGHDDECPSAAVNAGTVAATSRRRSSR